MGDPFGSSLSSHGQGRRQIGRAIVHSVNQMVMNVDHQSLFLLEPEAG